MTVGNAINHSPDIRSYRESPEFLDNNLVGIEIELENFNPGRNIDPVFSNYWNLTDDPSLRNNGIEFILRNPLAGHDLNTALELASPYIANATAGERTSTHVHLDIRAWDESLAQNFLLLYSVMEPILFRYIGADREANIYCWPFYNTEHILRNIGRMLHRRAGRFRSSGFVNFFNRDSDKYGAINLASPRTLGSLEFRHFKGTTDIEEIKQWINIIFAMKIAAGDLSTDLEETYGQLEEHDYNSIITKYFGNTALFNFSNTITLTSEYRKGIDTLERILMYGPSNNTEANAEEPEEATNIPRPAGLRGEQVLFSTGIGLQEWAQSGGRLRTDNEDTEQG
jgi:hypothetical protein